MEQHFAIYHKPTVFDEGTNLTEKSENFYKEFLYNNTNQTLHPLHQRRYLREEQKKNSAFVRRVPVIKSRIYKPTVRHHSLEDTTCDIDEHSVGSMDLNERRSVSPVYAFPNPQGRYPKTNGSSEDRDKIYRDIIVDKDIYEKRKLTIIFNERDNQGVDYVGCKPGYSCGAYKQERNFEQTVECTRCIEHIDVTPNFTCISSPPSYHILPSPSRLPRTSQFFFPRSPSEEKRYHPYAVQTRTNCGIPPPLLRQSSIRRRVRTIYTPSQLKILEEKFKECSFIVGEDREMLAKDLKLREQQVKIWFQNRRTKCKQEGKLDGPTKCTEIFNEETLNE